MKPRIFELNEKDAKKVQPILLPLDGVGEKNPYAWNELTQVRNRTSTPDRVKTKCLRIFTFITIALAFVLVASYVGYIAYEMISKRADESRYRSLFDDFQIRFNKVYDEDEVLRRYVIFKNNVIEFEEEELRHPGLDLDIGPFADMTIEEMRRNLGDMIDSSLPEMESAALPPMEQARPASFDWRFNKSLTQVKDQGQCGSCWAFATVASVETLHAIKTGKLVSLSEQEMVDCDKQNRGCRGGVRQYAMDFVRKSGLVGDAGYPYSAQEGQQCKLKQNETRIYITSYQGFTSRNEDQIADWVATKGPVTVGMNVTKPMYNYRSGVFNPSAEECKDQSLGSHAVTIIGYGKDEKSGLDYWIIKNSWGSWWGEMGYFKLARGVNSCGVANNAVAPVIN